MSSLRILLVEDDEAHARLIKERLHELPEAGSVRSCETLADALAMLRSDQARSFDVILSDLGLPDSEGIETVVAVHNAAPRLPIVVLSGRGDVAVAIEAMRHGAQDYIVKSSADAASLARVLRLAVERKRLQDTEQLLLGVVSHDLRGPLQTIVLGCEILQREHPGSRHTTTILSAALRATALVNDLLDATRARASGVLPIEPTEMDLVPVLLQMVEEARSLNPGRTIDLQMIEHAPLRGDAKRLGQLGQNLIRNALQHSPAAAAVRIALRRGGDQLELAVHNGGPPIPDRIRAHMFEPLERGSNDRSTSVGLGLYIASEIVRAHGGTIDVDSDAATGTTFLVRLPALGPATRASKPAPAR